MMDYFVVRMCGQRAGEMEVLFQTNDRQKAGKYFAELKAWDDKAVPHAFAFMYVIVSK